MPRRILSGRVTSDKMNKTVTVLVARRVMHPLYKKFIRRSKNYAAHDEDNICKIGDLVRIEECPPISKRKAWIVIERNGASLDEGEAADGVEAAGETEAVGEAGPVGGGEPVDEPVDPEAVAVDMIDADADAAAASRGGPAPAPV